MVRTIVILRPLPTSTFEAIGAVLPREEKALWGYISSGECRSISYDVEMPGGVVLEFETDTIQRVKHLVSEFPLVKEGLHQPEYHPLAPYTGLALLFDPAHGFTPNLPEAWMTRNGT